MPRREIKERCDEQTGHCVYEVGSLSYTVPDYHSNDILVHQQDPRDPVLSISVAVLTVVPKASRKSAPYAAWEEVCDVAYRKAQLQSRY